VATWREIFDPNGSSISQVSRCIQVTALSGNLNMPIYESKWQIK